jgi:uncharacterized membrane protein YcjF (UPF0283 family)
MFSKTKKSERIDSEQREQYNYALQRIRQKKKLFRHFVFFLAGSVLFIILSAFLNKGNEYLNNWYVYAILIWLFFLLVHVLNVFVINSFMGKEWEDKQLEKLKAKQVKRIAELQKRADTEFETPTESNPDHPPITPQDS